jgi:hypothetical protein
MSRTIDILGLTIVAICLAILSYATIVHSEEFSLTSKKVVISYEKATDQALVTELQEKSIVDQMIDAGEANDTAACKALMNAYIHEIDSQKK